MQRASKQTVGWLVYGISLVWASVALFGVEQGRQDDLGKEIPWVGATGDDSDSPSPSRESSTFSVASDEAGSKLCFTTAIRAFFVAN